ncbi:polyprenyl synthetase family protein [Bacillus sp. 2205SS5-2]|uniref:polyprenyl synthetase family protein n=1 Tax=Bacillus sp. 2205SS5-2 TaxID=3109031 RepID=UPI0030065AF6
MKKKWIENTDAVYELAEQKAAIYFSSLYTQVKEKTYVSSLTKEIDSWKHNHIHHPLVSFFSRKKKTSESKGYDHYLRWLDYTGKLDDYLDRSISYIFMRDLGQSLDSPTTQTRIRQVVDSLKSQLKTNDAGKADSLSMSVLYRMAQKEGIETTFIWLINKLKAVSSHIPAGMDAEQAQRKQIKIISGLIMHEMEDMEDAISSEERKIRLDQAIRLGYSYGLTYPFIDDLLDAKILSIEEEKEYSDLIRTTLITGSVPELGEWTGENGELIRYIHLELREAFLYIKAHQRPETIDIFFEQSYVFFHAQEVDRVKNLANPHYTNEELYIPVILKSSFSRLIVRSVMSASEDEEFYNRTFFYGLYNQLADDFADMFDDQRDGAVTPYTYYMKYHTQREDLVNPFELYWTVISHLIQNVYHSDPKTSEVILDRAINGLKRYKERMGVEKYFEVMELFASGIPRFNRLIQKMVQKADDVDFFDKFLRDQIITTLKIERKEQDDFLHTIKDVREQINKNLKIHPNNMSSTVNQSIIAAANYSLEGSGKRLRPIVTWMMSVHKYGLNPAEIIPLLKSLEYMHTASLIFDDLPSQDNATIRRGHPTLHTVHSIAVAELTGLFLTQKAIEEQTSLKEFNAKTVLKLIHYTTQVTEDMCKGQAMDLDFRGKAVTLEQLKAMGFYKTGLGFEASLIMPAILAHAEEEEIDALKKFAYHAGLAFQIKDDLLDVEGNLKHFGKAIGKDVENNHSTFVSILSLEGARKEMWEQYCLAIEALKKLPNSPSFLKHLVNYLVNRDH